jgi:hypothetical protein
MWQETVDAKFHFVHEKKGSRVELWNELEIWLFELRSWEVHWAECMCVVLCVKISRAQKVSAGADSRDARGKCNMRRRVRYVSGLLD